MIRCGTDDLTALENLLCGFYWRDDRPCDGRFDGARLSFIRKTLERLPARFRRRVEALALRKAQEPGGDYKAGRYLYDVRDELGGDYVSLAASDAEIVQVARDLAARCAGFIADSTQGLPFCARLAGRVGIDVPDGDKYGVAGVVSRLCDPVWWRRGIRKYLARKVEKHAIELGFVHSRAGKYASDESLERRVQQKKRNQKLLESIVSTNELGQSFTLADLASRGVSNPVIKRGELMMRIAGFEAVAKESGHVGEFYTLTCPSKYHARLSSSGAENPKFEGGLTPRQGQAYLCGVWSRIRAQLLKREHGCIKLYGVRVVEPQHDGTPHWHLLVFMERSQVAAVRAVFRGQALKEDGQEPGALEHRFTAVAIDWGRGSAAGYVAKYISKNIDGHGLDCDIDGRAIDDAVRRVDAWASTWGIRQFQFVGGAPVTTWRELRRVEVGDGGHGIVYDAARAADVADWREYIKIQGGPVVARKDLRVRLLRVWSDVLGRYGDARGDITKGVQDAAKSIVTRVHVWVSSFKDLALPWSTVNNCNQHLGGKLGDGKKSGIEKAGGGGKSGKSDGYAGKNRGVNRFADLHFG